MDGSCRVSASAALHEGRSSSVLSSLRISGYNSATVGRRCFLFLFAELFGCPRTNCPLPALFPRSSQYRTRDLRTQTEISEELDVTFEGELMRFLDGRVELAATDLANHLSCRHLTALNLQLARGKIDARNGPIPMFAYFKNGAASTRRLTLQA